VGIYVGHADGTGFTLCDMTYLLELEKVVLFNENNA
jgi:hypothetical protein